MPRPFNFSPGPAALPEPVLRQAASEMLDWNGTGVSVMEMSHRGKEFMAICRPTSRPTCASCSRFPTNYKVLFLQGGAIGQNAIVPMNLLRGRTRADYVNTGAWSTRSIAEADALLLASTSPRAAKANGFTAIPPQSRVAPRSRRGLRPHLRQRDDRRPRVPLDAGHRRRAAGRRHVVEHPVAADRRLALRPDLRRRAEEHRPGRPHASSSSATTCSAAPCRRRPRRSTTPSRRRTTR